MAEATIDAMRTIASGLYLEGLAADAGRGLIWYSDVVGGGVHGVTPEGEPRHRLNPERRWTGGVLVNGDGTILSSGEGGIRWNDPERDRSGWLVADIDGAAVNGINEMAPDGAGGLFFGTVDLAAVIAGGRPGPTALYHLPPGGRPVKVADGIGFSNGLAVDAGRSRLYCNDTFTGVWRFDFGSDMRLSNRHLLLDKPDADGMALDAGGVLWITGYRSGAFCRLDTDGRRLPDVTTPAGAITQLRFAGADLRDLYFNAVPVDGGDTLKNGGVPDAAASFLHRGRGGGAGGGVVAPPRARPHPPERRERGEPGPTGA
ncbi:MAG: SMP-30/gluconolactonase/LRE family protein, partial [Sphingomonas sp.]